MKARALVWTLGLSGALLALGLSACGGTPKAPDLITRELPSGQVDPVTTPIKPDDPLSAGGGFLDAGCCMVAFALPRGQDQIAAQLVLPNAKYPMDDYDAGYWTGVACLPPTGNYFYFEVGYAADDVDSGTILYVEKVNEALPVSTTTFYADKVNVFDAPDGGVCGGIDAERYLTLPDAG